MRIGLIAGLSAAAVLAACGGMPFGGAAGGGELHVEPQVQAGGRPLLRAGQPLRARVATFVDERGMSPRKLGDIRATVRDMYGTELKLDRDVATLVGEVTRAQLAADGLRLVDAGAEADIAVEGVVKALSLEVAGRDERNIRVEVSLRDATSGKLLWAGAIADRDDRYAGVAGNSRASIAAFLDEGMANYATRLGAALHETLPKIYADAVESARPPAHTAVPGVTTLQAPVALPVVAPPAPVAAPVAAPVVKPTSAATTGHFVVQTVPPRARVYVGDVYQGMTPLRLELPAGVAMIGLKLGGYRSVTEKVAIRTGETTELELPLEKQ